MTCGQADHAQLTSCGIESLVKGVQVGICVPGILLLLMDDNDGSSEDHATDHHAQLSRESKNDIPALLSSSNVVAMTADVDMLP
jgi:hypothetical protein